MESMNKTPGSQKRSRMMRIDGGWGASAGTAAQHGKKTLNGMLGAEEIAYGGGSKAVWR